jgi:O-antigen/teichoic acid export membrane protein
MLYSLSNARHKLSTLLQTIRNASVIKHFFIYSFGSFFMRSISMILVPFNMRKLTPTDYGTLSLITTFITIATALMGLGLRQVLSIEFFHHDTIGRKRIITEMLIIYTTIAIPCVALVWHLRTPIITYLFFNTISPAQLAPALITVFLFFYAELLYQLLQYEQKVTVLAILQSMLALISAAITVISLWLFQIGLVGIVWAQAIITALASLIFCILLFKQYAIQTSLHAGLSKSYYYLLYGLPFIPGIICSWMLSSADRWVLASYRSMHEVGIYTIADMGSQLFYTLVLIPWSGSYLPYIMKRYAEQKNNLALVEHKNRQIMYISMISATVAILIGSFVSRSFLHYLLPPTYYAAIPYMFILLLGQVFLLGSYFASTLIQFRKKSLFLAFALAMPASMNLLLNLVFVPYFGIAGCSIATLISYGIYFMITLLYNKRLI